MNTGSENNGQREELQNDNDGKEERDTNTIEGEEAHKSERWKENFGANNGSPKPHNSKQILSSNQNVNSSNAILSSNRSILTLIAFKNN